MNIPSLLSLVSLAAFLGAAVILSCMHRQIGLSSRVFISFLLSLLIYTFIVVSNFLEHTGITAVLDPIEDLTEVLFTLIFLFLFYNWRNERVETRFQDLFRHAPLPFAEITRGGKFLNVNEQMESELQRNFGISQPLETDLRTWWRHAFPDPTVFESVTATWHHAVEQAYRSGTAIHPRELEMTYLDGVRHSKIIGGSRIGDNLLLTMTDITERKRDAEEKNRLQQQLLQSQKLEAVGTLAGGVAHDFNNMLGAVIGYADLTTEEMAPDDPLRENIMRILDAANRSSRLVRQLLIFARKQNSKEENLDINQTIQTTFTMLQRLLGENITLTWLPYAGPEPCMVHIDPAHLDQIMVNLCINARDAINDIGKITLKTDLVTFDTHSCSLYADCHAGTYVRLSVSDSGYGMTKETASHIFEPFFTTKEIGKGTGLGLSTVYGIVKQCGGFINCYSELNIGTTFHLYLPQEKSGEVREGDTIEEPIPAGNGETILLVEDDPMLMEMSHRMLELLNYEVMSAATPGEAIEVMNEYGDRIDLVLSDVIMPEMNGRELIGRLRKIRPDFKCLFMSGYTDDIVIPKGTLREEGALFIQKPFSRREIANRLREILEPE